jgi:S1-C subfamily serine protease
MKGYIRMRGFSSSRRLNPLAATTLAITLSGCSILGIGVRREYQSPIDPSAAPITYDAAAAVSGRDLSTLAVEAETTTANVPLDSQTVRRVAEKAMPAVVSIYTETSEPYRVSLFPIPIPGTYFRVPVRGEALGSAFFIHPSGYLLSNNHVIVNASSIKAHLADGTSYDLLVVARDAALDIALLRVAAPNREFDYVPLGNSDEIGVGERVIAVGNPLGLGHTVTEGIISQTGRALFKVAKAQGRYIEFLQTDTAVNPGSSGGPLITLSGAAIGINTAVVADAQGIAFTIPSSQVREFLQFVLGGGGDRREQPKPQFKGSQRPLGE